MSANWRFEIPLEHHTNISEIQKGLLNNLLDDPGIHDEWIANFLKNYSRLTKEIEYLQMLLAIMDENECRDKVTKCHNKKSRNRVGISRLNPQSLAQTVPSHNNPPTTHVLNKEAHFHATKR